MDEKQRKSIQSTAQKQIKPGRTKNVQKIKVTQKAKGQKKFPVFAVILLIVAVMWLLNDLEIVAVDIPWIPIIIAVIAVGMIFKRFKYNA